MVASGGNRTDSGRFQPGVSGNLKGRPKGRKSEAEKFRTAAKCAARRLVACPMQGEDGCGQKSFKTYHAFVAHMATVHNSAPHAQLLDKYFPKPAAEVHVAEIEAPSQAELEKIRGERLRLYEEMFPGVEPRKWPVPIEDILEGTN